MTTLPERLRQARTEAGWTQTELAEELGLTQSTVAKYERGESDLPTATLRAVCLALNCSADYFLDLLSDARGNVAPGRHVPKKRKA